jgi:hypothetical protein
MEQLQLSPEIQNKIIEEWNEIAAKHEKYSESGKLAWVEFSGKIEKEYGLTAWQVWELVREKKTIEETNNREPTKWYKKPIYVVTERNFISVLLFVMSLAFYAIEKMSDSKTAKFISMYSFFLGIGENIGDKIGEKYSSKNISRLFLLFVAISCIIFLSIKNIIKSAEIIEAVFVGIGLGGLMGFELKQMRRKNLMD